LRTRQILLRLQFLRGFRLGEAVEGHGFAHEGLEGGFVDFFTFVNVDRAAYVPVEARIEETRGIR
jgi:hypothetical protein